MRDAHEFFIQYLPFWQMQHDDALTSRDNDYVFAKKGDIYAIYLMEGGSAMLNLKNVEGDFTVQWYDPRNGGPLQQGDVKMVRGGSEQSLGHPPKDQDKDWAVLVKRVGYEIDREIED